MKDQHAKPETLEKYAPALARLRKGEKLSEVAPDFGVSVSWLSFLAREAGIVLRKGRRVEPCNEEAWNGSVTPGARCRCGLLLPCFSCGPTAAKAATAGWGQWL